MAVGVCPQPGARLQVPVALHRQGVDLAPDPVQLEVGRERGMDPGRRDHVGACGLGDVDHVQGRGHRRHGRQASGQVERDPSTGVAAHAALELAAMAPRQRPRHRLPQGVHAVAQALDQPARHQAVLVAAQHRSDAALDELGDDGEQLGLQRGRHPSLQRLDLVPQGVGREHPAGDQVAAGHVGNPDADLLADPEADARAHLVDDRDRDRGGDDLAPQPVRADAVGEALHELGREIGGEDVLHEGVVGDVAGDDRLEIVHPAVGEQHREFRLGQALAGGQPRRERLAVGQPLELAVEAPGLFQHLDEAGLFLQALRPAREGDADRQGLGAVVGQHEAGHVVGHLREQPIALLPGQVAGHHAAVEQHLDVDLAVGAVDPAGVVDRVGVDLAAGLGELDPRPLGETEVAALAHHLAAQAVGVDPQRVVGLVVGRRVRLGGGLDEGPDAAVPQQVDRGPQQGLYQLGRRQPRGLDAQGGGDLRGDRYRLGTARVDPATGGDQAAVVIRPARLRQVEQPFALGVGERGIRVRVEKDVLVVEGPDQANRA